MTTTDVQARESRLRRLAERRGLSLQKSKRRDRMAPDFGKFRLIEVMGEHAVVLGAERFAFSATMDDIEKWFEDHAEKDTDGGTVASIVRVVKGLNKLERQFGGPVPLCGPIASAKSGEQ